MFKIGYIKKKIMTLITGNGQVHDLAVDEDPLLLWVLRDHLGWMEIKYSCGIGECGLSRSCSTAEVRAVRPADAGECLPAAGDHHFGWDKVPV